jgi:hypothetical protein
MRQTFPVALIVLGAIIIIVPVVAHAYSANRDKDRVAEFYTRNSNAATLPPALTPAEYTIYDYMCFWAGAVLAAVGSMYASKSVRRTWEPVSNKPS